MGNFFAGGGGVYEWKGETCQLEIWPQHPTKNLAMGNMSHRQAPIHWSKEETGGQFGLKAVDTEMEYLSAAAISSVRLLVSAGFTPLISSSEGMGKAHAIPKTFPNKKITLDIGCQTGAFPPIHNNFKQWQNLYSV